MYDFFWRLSKWFPSLSKEQLIAFAQHRDLLLRYNQRLNLISPHTVQKIDQIHFADSILGCQYIHSFLSSQTSVLRDTLYDLGSGNGFPGIIFSILYPNQKVCLVEIQPRKVEYLKQLVFLLQLKNISFSHKDASSLHPQSVTYAMTRAYKPISYLLSTHSKIFSSKTHVFHFKGKNWQKELNMDESKNQKWKHVLLGSYQLPDQKEKKNLFILRSSYLL